MDVNTRSPPPFSSPSPEEVRSFRNLQVRETHNPEVGLRHSAAETDDQEMFTFDDSMTSPRDDSSAQKMDASEPALFVSPADYVPRSRSIPSPTPEASKVTAQPRSRGMHRSSSAAPAILSASEPSKIGSGRSTNTLSGPATNLSCCCCHASFIGEANLAYHFATDHRGKHSHPTPLIRSCTFCGESFQSRKDLDVHLLACGVVLPRKGGKKQVLIDANAERRYSTLSLSPPGHDAPASGRESQLSLTSITSSPSEFELSDFNSADDESTTIHKLVQDARKYALHNVGKTTDVEGDPISPTKRRKSAISSRFAKNFTKNITKAIETGRIKIEGLSDSLDLAVTPADASEPSLSIRTKGFPQPGSKGFDYSRTIELLQALSLGEPINKFLRDLEKHLAFRRTKELKELEAIYTERSWRKFHEFLSQAHDWGQGPLSSHQQSLQPLAPFQSQSHGRTEPRMVTLSVSRDIEFALNRQLDFPFSLGDFSAGEFRRWLDMIFNPPISFMENHLILPEFNVKIRSLQDLEAFLNLELPTRQGSGRRSREDIVTVFIRENWTELIAGTPGHHY
ncbi:hypothetical protein Dda_6311 [Drechslerella dactyloides]|uniref:C2H2-type domain-containing protein n=1 Tax=Drechslerella dactyloides TaxID=74499 RepID=A0AAD6IVG9_DREDA|nr:hypothetical protein Dda_6311 [Drechslerella dactyloides]